MKENILLKWKKENQFKSMLNYFNEVDLNLEYIKNINQSRLITEIQLNNDIVL